MADKLTLRQLRAKDGHSVMEIAAALGIHERSLYNWELGYSLPTLELADALAKYFGTTLDGVDWQFDKLTPKFRNRGKNAKK